MHNIIGGSLVKNSDDYLIIKKHRIQDYDTKYTFPLNCVLCVIFHFLQAVSRGGFDAEPSFFGGNSGTVIGL